MREREKRCPQFCDWPIFAGQGTLSTIGWMTISCLHAMFSDGRVAPQCSIRKVVEKSAESRYIWDLRGKSQTSSHKCCARHIGIYLVSETKRTAGFAASIGCEMKELHVYLVDVVASLFRFSLLLASCLVERGEDDGQPWQRRKQCNFGVHQTLLRVEEARRITKSSSCSDLF